ncbi:hypothetical protein, partial [Bradyrhizobium sp.]
MKIASDLILRSGPLAASRRLATGAMRPSFETPRKRAAPQDEGYADDTGGGAGCEAPRGIRC